MKRKVLTIDAVRKNGKPALYCKEFMKTIPVGIIEKGKTGCGLTSVALENADPTILIVPTKHLVSNKAEQYPNVRYKQKVFPVSSDYPFIETELHDYLEKNKTPKIITTIDSFSKVINSIGDTSIDFKIVVDEFTEFLDAYSYRSDAIQNCMKSLEKFTNVSFITATPLNKEYLPKSMVNLDLHKISWKKKEITQAFLIKSPNPTSTISNIISTYKEGEFNVSFPDMKRFKPKVIYFFINHVTEIGNIINEHKLDTDQVNIVCSDTEKNALKLSKYKIGKVPKKNQEDVPFNFLTCTAYKGIDIYSEHGLAILYTDITETTTLISMDTDLHQIVGRFRNKKNQFKENFLHIVNNNYKWRSEQFKEEFDQRTAKKWEDTINLEKLLKKYPAMKGTLVKAIKALDDKTFFSINEEGEYFNDDMKYKNLLRQKDIVKSYSAESFEENYRKTINISTKLGYDKNAKPKKNNNKISISNSDVRSAFYNMPKSGKIFNHQGRPLKDKLIDDLITEALIIPNIGPSGMKNLEFSYKRISNMIKHREQLNNVFREVIGIVSLGDKHSSQKIKKNLQEIYEKHEIKMKAIAKDLRFFFSDGYMVEYRKDRAEDNKFNYYWIIEMIKN